MSAPQAARLMPSSTIGVADSVLDTNLNPNDSLVLEQLLNAESINPFTGPNAFQNDDPPLPLFTLSAEELLERLDPARQPFMAAPLEASAQLPADFDLGEFLLRIDSGNTLYMPQPSLPPAAIPSPLPTPSGRPIKKRRVGSRGRAVAVSAPGSQLANTPSQTSSWSPNSVPLFYSPFGSDASTAVSPTASTSTATPYAGPSVTLASPLAGGSPSVTIALPSDSHGALLARWQACGLDTAPIFPPQPNRVPRVAPEGNRRQSHEHGTSTAIRLSQPDFVLRNGESSLPLGAWICTLFNTVPDQCSDPVKNAIGPLGEVKGITLCMFCGKFIKDGHNTRRHTQEHLGDVFLTLSQTPHEIEPSQFVILIMALVCWYGREGAELAQEVMLLGRPFADAVDRFFFEYGSISTKEDSRFTDFQLLKHHEPLLQFLQLIAAWSIAKLQCPGCAVTFPRDDSLKRHLRSCGAYKDGLEDHTIVEPKHDVSLERILAIREGNPTIGTRNKRKHSEH